MTAQANPLQSGSAISQGVSPQQKLQERKQQEKNQAKEIAQFAVEHGVDSTITSYHLSESSVIKICILRAKRDQLDISHLLDVQKIEDSKAFIVQCHTTSIKKLLTLAKGAFSEGELRLSRYLLQNQQDASWDY